VKLLLWRGADAYSKDSDGRTPLSYAVDRGHEEVVKLLLDTGMVDADSMDDFGRTALSFAAENGEKRVVELLLGVGVDVDSKDADGRTPLWYAAENGHEEVVELLLDTGMMDADSTDDFGWNSVPSIITERLPTPNDDDIADLNWNYYSRKLSPGGSIYSGGGSNHQRRRTK